MNLHMAVRGLVGVVNPDQPVQILRSAGYGIDATGASIPRYLQAQTVMAQVQALSGGDLKHAEFLNLQGVLRSVYLYGDTQGIVRPTVQGGDLLQFAEYPGAPISNWLVTEVMETWNGTPGWSHVIATLQVDPAP